MLAEIREKAWFRKNYILLNDTYMMNPRHGLELAVESDMSLRQLHAHRMMADSAVSHFVGGMMRGLCLSKNSMLDATAGYIRSHPGDFLSDQIAVNTRDGVGGISLDRAERLLEAHYLNALRHADNYLRRWVDYAKVDWNAEPQKRSVFVSN